MEKDLSSCVWSQAVLSSTQDTHPPTLDGALQVDSTNLGLAFFACLIGRRDLLPKVESNAPPSQQQPPNHLLWRFNRLLETAHGNYAAFDSSDEKLHASSRHELNLKRRLITPELRRCALLE